MKALSSDKLVLYSAILALASLALMTWSVVSRDVVPVVTAMGVGQGLGVASLLFYGWAVLRDMKKLKLLGGENETETRGS